MKGIIIYEDYRGKEVVEAIKLGVVNYTTSSSYGDWVSELSGIRKESTQAYCNKEDTYDFETGALIALMKMCGREKTLKTVEELYFLKEPRGADFDGDVLESKAEYMAKENKRLTEENEKLQHDYYLCKNSENALKCSVDYFNKSIAKLNIANEAYRKENKMLCDKIKFLDKENRNLVFGGRQNGKQYTFLVEMFKKLDQKKVDEAYKEAYNTKLPVWQREFLKEALSIYKPPTKREKMWNDILACGDCERSKYVKVKKEDLEMFAKECNEKKLFIISGYEFHLQEFWFDADSCIFQIFRKPSGFVCAQRVYLASKDVVIDYIPPMRWDLFKKGRRIIRVNTDKLDEFMTKCSKELGGIMRPNLKRYKEFTHLFVRISDYHYDNKPTVHIMTPEDLVRNQHENSKKYSDKKIVDWEDVR